jgi:hypothetical protein
MVYSFQSREKRHANKLSDLRTGCTRLDKCILALSSRPHVCVAVCHVLQILKALLIRIKCYIYRV